MSNLTAGSKLASDAKTHNIFEDEGEEPAIVESPDKIMVDLDTQQNFIIGMVDTQFYEKRK